MNAPRRAAEIACAIDVFSPGERAEHAGNAARWREAVVSTSELEDGYRFELERGDGLIEAVARFIALESRCCPFFEFRFDVTASGPLSLAIAGPPGAKELLGGLLPAAGRLEPSRTG